MTQFAFIGKTPSAQDSYKVPRNRSGRPGIEGGIVFEGIISKAFKTNILVGGGGLKHIFCPKIKLFSYAQAFSIVV